MRAFGASRLSAGVESQKESRARRWLPSVGSYLTPSPGECYGRQANAIIRELPPRTQFGTGDPRSSSLRKPSKVR